MNSTYFEYLMFTLILLNTICLAMQVSMLSNWTNTHILKYTNLIFLINLCVCSIMANLSPSAKLWISSICCSPASSLWKWSSNSSPSNPGYAMHVYYTSWFSFQIILLLDICVQEVFKMKLYIIIKKKSDLRWLDYKLFLKSKSQHAVCSTLLSVLCILQLSSRLNVFHFGFCLSSNAQFTADNTLLIFRNVTSHLFNICLWPEMFYYSH